MRVFGGTLTCSWLACNPETRRGFRALVVVVVGDAWRLLLFVLLLSPRELAELLRVRVRQMLGVTGIECATSTPPSLPVAKDNSSLFTTRKSTLRVKMRPRNAYLRTLRKHFQSVANAA